MSLRLKRGSREGPRAPVFIKSISLWAPSAAPLSRPLPLLPRVPCFPLGLSGPDHADSLPFVLPLIRPALRGARHPGGAVASAQVPAELGAASEEARLALQRDPLAPFPGQVADAAETGGAVAGADAAGHL